jgi:raffinose/stachyose/melibiose transport system permease protein
MSTVAASETKVKNQARQPKKKSPINADKGQRLYYLYLIPGLFLFATVIGGSFFFNTYVGFTKWNGLGSPRWVGLENYIKLMGDNVFWESFLHAFAFIAAMSIIPTFLGVFIASFLFDFVGPRFGNRAASALRAGFYMPQIVPLTITGILWAWLLAPTTGVINNFFISIGLPQFALNWLGEGNLAIISLSVIMVWIQIGYTIVIFMSGLSRLDPSLTEAAQIDGANWMQRFRIIILAQLGPEIGVVLLTTTVAALKVFGPVYVMTGGGPGTATVVPSFFSYFHFFTTTKVGYGAAVATVLSLLLTILAIVILQVQNKQNKAANER